jgi:hypothetical protein
MSLSAVNVAAALVVFYFRVVVNWPSDGARVCILSERRAMYLLEFCCGFIEYYKRIVFLLL